MFRSILKAIIAIVLVLIGWTIMAKSLTYKQTDCTYSLADRYIWIELSNGIEDKGISFVSDGVKFYSAILGLSTALGYDSIIRIVLVEGEEDLGYLSVVRKNKKTEEIVTKDIGLIKSECWSNLKDLIIANPLSQHIEMLELHESNRNTVH